jgi:putative phosphoesterase
VARALDGVDVILHAGDVCRAETLVELEAFAPVHAVLGNNDTPDVAAWGAPERLELELAGVPIAMIHDSGPASGRQARLRRMFPSAALVVFGHSHIPMDLVDAGQRILNPGSPTDRRRQPHGTMAELELSDGELRSARIFPVS